MRCRRNEGEKREDVELQYHQGESCSGEGSGGCGGDGDADGMVVVMTVHVQEFTSPRAPLRVGKGREVRIQSNQWEEPLRVELYIDTAMSDPNFPCCLIFCSELYVV